MFIKKTKNTRGQTYYQIAERKDGKSHHRTLMSLGKSKDDRLEDLSELISRHLDIISANQLAKKIDIKNTFILGPLLIIDAIFKQLNLYELLADLKKKHPKLRFDFVKIIFTLVISRFVEPCSKLQVFSHWQKLFYPDFLEKELHLQDIYRSLDILAEHKEDIDFISNMNYKKYISHPTSKDKPQLNEDAIKASEQQDGFFGIITNAKNLSSKELILNYKHLWKVEKAFRDIKGFLKTRPMFHWTDKRILGHLVLCFISYLCEAYLSKKLYEKGIKCREELMTGQNKQARQLSVSEAMLKLKEVRAVPVTLKDKTLWMRTDITGHATDVFKAVKIPAKPIKA